MKTRSALIYALLALAMTALVVPDYSSITSRYTDNDQKISRHKTTDKTIVSIASRNRSVQFKVSIADTWFSRARGLQNVSFMEADQGMLFIYQNAALRQFWMKNTRLPLDIVFLDDQRRVVHIARNTTPFSQKPIRSFAPFKFALEINAGRALGLSVGDEMTLASSQPL